jgi:VWFA-related protein
MTSTASACIFFCVECVIAQNEPFRVQTNIVQVPVVVTGKNDRNVDGLAARDFSVLDDGVRQEVTVDDFSSGLAPISLAIAIQTSGISTPVPSSIRHIGGMIQPLVLGLRGEASVVTFDSEISWLQEFTADDDKIHDAVKSLKPASAMSQARMLDAVVEVAQRMQERRGRKVLLLISENRDRGSETTFQQAVEAVERQGIQVFAAHYSAYATSLIAKPKDLPDLPPQVISGDPEDWPDSPPGIDFLAIFAEVGRLAKTNAVQALTRVTGGADYAFTKNRGLEEAIEKLGVEVHNQYVLSFRQRKGGNGMHQISVSVLKHDDLRIRSRRTYWADQTIGQQ